MTQQQLLDELQVGTQSEMIANRFSGEEVELEPLAVALYDYIMGCEWTRNYKGMQIGLNIFRKKWPREYMVLLD
jgi:hypothetical protein